MTVKEIIRKDFEFLVEDISSVYEKRWLIDAIVSHLSKMHSNIPPETVRHLVIEFFDKGTAK